MKKTKSGILMKGLAALIALLGVDCAAAVSWAGTAAELRVAPGQEKAVAEFAFRNSGQQPLRFTSLRPSCDCLTAAASKEVFAPGERGTVRVEFTVGGRSGWQEKYVMVTTDDPAEKPVSLLVVIEISEPVAMQPRQLLWEKGAVAAEQTVAIRLADPGKAARVEAQCADERFTVAVEPAKGAGAYRLRARPVTSVPGMGMNLTYETKCSETVTITVAKDKAGVARHSARKKSGAKARP